RFFLFFFFSSRRRHTRSYGDWSSDVCSSDLASVDGQAVKAEKQDDALLVPLTRGENRDRAFAVEIVYAENIGSLKSFTARQIARSEERRVGKEWRTQWSRAR